MLYSLPKCIGHNCNYAILMHANIMYVNVSHFFTGIPGVKTCYSCVGETKTEILDFSSIELENMTM